jgi:hypothetical protein
MSAGQFLDAFYETNNGNICAIRIQPETAALVLNAVTNTIPAGPADQLASAKAGGGRRTIGVNARQVRVRFTGAVPEGYQPGGEISLPWLQFSTFEALPKNATGTYLGSGVILTGRSPETIR